MAKKRLPKSICGSPDRPLKIGNLEIPCFVLEDTTRVISGRGLTTAIGMKGRGQGASRIPTHKTLKPFISNELSVAILNPIEFAGPGNKRTTGYEATILHDLCLAILDARDAGVLKTEQEIRYANCCDILIRSIAKVGIIALVDEATGYQDIRVKTALADILEKFIAKEYHAWTKTFPDAFYREIFDLNNWPWNPKSFKRPSVIGHYTNDFIYDRLAPGVLEELRRLNPPTEKGHRKVKHFQWLTGSVGHPALRAHIEGVMALMRAAPNMRRFKEMLNRAYPKFGENIALALEYEDEDK